jgi:hypothetical protein
MRSSLLESIIVIKFRGTEVYSSVDLITAEYRISELSVVKEETVIVRRNPSFWYKHFAIDY